MHASWEPPPWVLRSCSEVGEWWSDAGLNEPWWTISTKLVDCMIYKLELALYHFTKWRRFLHHIMKGSRNLLIKLCNQALLYFFFVILMIKVIRKMPCSRGFKKKSFSMYISFITLKQLAWMPIRSLSDVDSFPFDSDFSLCDLILRALYFCSSLL